MIWCQEYVSSRESVIWCQEYVSSTERKCDLVSRVSE